MKGKKKCGILKRIRQKIARDNNIPLDTADCTHQGDCTGTCPKCEAELQYLEKELQKRTGEPVISADEPVYLQETAGLFVIERTEQETTPTPEYDNPYFNDLPEYIPLTGYINMDMDNPNGANFNWDEI